MKRHPIYEKPPDGERILVGTEDMTFIGYWRAFGGPFFLEGERTPSLPLTWWAKLPAPGLRAKP